MKKAIAAALALTLVAAASGQTVGVAQMPSSTTLGGRIDFEKIRTLPASSAAVNWLFANVPFLRQEGKVLLVRIAGERQDAAFRVQRGGRGFDLRIRRVNADAHEHREQQNDGQKPARLVGLMHKTYPFRE